ncbi:MAG TPA: glycosyltransferase family 2 protein [Candidatus Dormibacteraeota bacterium]
MSRVAVIIPALNEAGAIGDVVAEIRATVDAEVIVVDNGSQDQTATVARRAGAVVVTCPERGYGKACLRGIAEARGNDVLVFIDGDGSMPAVDIPALVGPILDGRADIVCGARRADPGTMPAHQRWGNRLSMALLRSLYGVRLSDLGPFRAVRATTLASLAMRASKFAWPAEMLARAAKVQARIIEVPVGYRARAAGRSKVGGTLRGSIGAGMGIVGSLAWVRMLPR